jgi:hypothetical protein
MSRPNKGDGDSGSGAAHNGDGSSATAKVVEPDPQVAGALRKIARLFPAGFSVSVRKSPTIGRIELVCSSDKQWKNFQENDSSAMRFSVERREDGQLIATRITKSKKKSTGNGKGQMKPQGNGQGKPARTGAPKRERKNDAPEEITLPTRRKKRSKRSHI